MHWNSKPSRSSSVEGKLIDVSRKRMLSNNLTDLFSDFVKDLKIHWVWTKGTFLNIDVINSEYDCEFSENEKTFSLKRNSISSAGNSFYTVTNFFKCFLNVVAIQPKFKSILDTWGVFILHQVVSLILFKDFKSASGGRFENL